MENNYYPVFLNLRNKNILILGGGDVAFRKVQTLLKTGANITVISPEINTKIKKIVQSGNIKYLKKVTNLKSVVKKYFLVISATDDECYNQEIFHLCSENNIPVNVVDNPKLCSFIVPASFNRGKIQVAISTSGESPALARKIKEELKMVIGPEFIGILKKWKKHRDTVKTLIPVCKDRMKYWRKLGTALKE